MSGGVFVNRFAREIPDHLISGVKSGKYRVVGNLIQTVKSGRIKGQLQETSRLINLRFSNASLPFEMMGQGISIVQNEQIKSAVAAVHSLQLANLALGAVSIGVSVAGTAYLAQRLSQLERTVDMLLPEMQAIARGIEALRRDRIVDDITRLATLSSQLDEAWSLADATLTWRSIASEAHFLADSFERRSQDLAQALNGRPLLLESFVDAFSVASSIRVTARLGAGDDLAARDAAEARANALILLGREVRLYPIVAMEMAAIGEQVGEPGWASKLEEVTALKKAEVDLFRQREVSAATTVLTLEELGCQGISGRAWLEEARAETEAPFIFLPAS